jgi:hypothetical protein
LPDMTSDTVDCETPARRATSTLVTRVSAGDAIRESHHGRRVRVGGVPAHRPQVAELTRRSSYV